MGQLLRSPTRPPESDEETTRERGDLPRAGHETPWVLVRTLPFLATLATPRAAESIRSLGAFEGVPRLSALRAAGDRIQVALLRNVDFTTQARAELCLNGIIHDFWDQKYRLNLSFPVYETELARLPQAMQRGVEALRALEPPAFDGNPDAKASTAVSCLVNDSGEITVTYCEDVGEPRIPLVMDANDQLYETVAQPTPLGPRGTEFRAERIRTLLRWGADPNVTRDGIPLLRLAINNRDAAAVEALLSHGALPREPLDPHPEGMSRFAAGAIRDQLQAALIRLEGRPAPPPPGGPSQQAEHEW